MISFKEKINMSLIKNNIKIEKNPFDLLENCLLYTSDAADE